MPPKRKAKLRKSKKGKKRNEDRILNKKFCSETITTLNRELAHLRKQKFVIDEIRLNITNELLAVEKSRSDEADFLEKQKKNKIIQLNDMETHLEEIRKLRQHEIEEFNEILTELEDNYMETQKNLVIDLQILNTDLKTLHAQRLNMDQVYDFAASQFFEAMKKEHTQKFEIMKAQNAVIISQDNIRTGVMRHVDTVGEGMNVATQIYNITLGKRVFKDSSRLKSEITHLLKKEQQLSDKYDFKKRFIDDFILQIEAINDICVKLENKLYTRTKKLNQLNEEIQKKKAENQCNQRYKMMYLATKKDYEKNCNLIKKMEEILVGLSKKEKKIKKDIQLLSDETNVYQKAINETTNSMNIMNKRLDALIETSDKIEAGINLNFDEMQILKLQRRDFLFELYDLIAGTNFLPESLTNIKFFEETLTGDNYLYRPGNLGFTRLKEIDSKMDNEKIEQTSDFEQKFEIEQKSETENESKISPIALKTTTHSQKLPELR